MTSDVVPGDAPTQPSVDSWWLGGGAVLIVIAVVAAATRWDAIRASHPAYAITLVVVALAGTLLLSKGARPPTSKPAGRRRTLVRAALVVGVVFIGVAAWSLRPVGASPIAVNAMEDGGGVDVSMTATRITMTPMNPRRNVGLVFYPGGLLDPRAYVNILRPIAEAGYPVAIVKAPFGLAFLAQSTAADIATEEAPEVAWVVGGHSLGGVAAAGAVGDGDDLAGLVLWASFPAGSLAGRTDVAVTSIFGTNDGITTPARVAESKSDLPPGATFVDIDGAIHSFFGDYGTQRADGTPNVSRDVAQEQIVAATLDLLESVASRQP